MHAAVQCWQRPKTRLSNGGSQNRVAHVLRVLLVITAGLISVERALLLEKAVREECATLGVETMPCTIPATGKVLKVRAFDPSVRTMTVMVAKEIHIHGRESSLSCGRGSGSGHRGCPRGGGDPWKGTRSRGDGRDNWENHGRC